MSNHTIASKLVTCRSWPLMFGRMPVRGLVRVVLFLTACVCPPQAGAAAGAETKLKLLTLNLHGYHPMREPTRYLQDRELSTSVANSYLTYFTMEEIERGHHVQLDALREAIVKVRPDIILLQEVGAGLPHSRKDCDEFLDFSRGDVLGSNSALRLQSRLSRTGVLYEIALACRGNIGWVTDWQTFRDHRIVRYSSGRVSPLREAPSPSEVVFDFSSNPYPNGLLVEGTAILVAAPWRIVEKATWHISVLGTGESFFFQIVRVRTDKSPTWYLVANFHGGHKVRHFEQAVAVREALARYVNHHPDRDSFGGAILGGDMNARLYRPSLGLGEVATIPWEIRVPGEFDFGPQAPYERFEDLTDALWTLNLDNGYKPWAGLGDSPEAWARVSEAARWLASFVQGPLVQDPLFRRFNLREGLDEANRTGRCQLRHESGLDPSCEIRERIDLVYLSSSFTVGNAAAVFSKNDYQSLRGVSDHPGILLDLIVMP